MPADPSSVSPSEREIEAVAAEARGIAAYVANAAKFHRLETLIDQLEDAALDRVRDARGDDEAVVWRSMLDRIRIHGASGLWTGEDCAIGAVAALEGGDAGRAFMLERESARSSQDEGRKVHSADCEWVWGAIGCTCGIGIGLPSRPQGEDHEAGIEAFKRAWSPAPLLVSDARIARAIVAYLSRCPSPERDTEKP